MTTTNQELLRGAYAAYNRQDSDALLALVREDVEWPDGSARLQGKAALWTYWTRQWTMTRTHDEPVEITDLAPDQSVVRINGEAFTRIAAVGIVRHRQQAS